MPKEKFKLDLEKLKSVLETKEFKTKAYTGTLLSIEKKCKINIYKSGKIVVLNREEDDDLSFHDDLCSILYPYTKA